MILRGIDENLPYSLSRWTDVPAGKWPWFLRQLKQGWMEAFDPKGTPGTWSLLPEDTHELVFWTKNPANLIKDKELLRGYDVKIHVTATGWHEVERGTPSLEDASRLLGQTVEAFGPSKVTWRFSPIPNVPDVAERFAKAIAIAAPYSLTQVYVSFLQDNARLNENRTSQERLDILVSLGVIAQSYGIVLQLCQDDSALMPLLAKGTPGLSLGICAPPKNAKQDTFSCGCAKSVDPFSVNEACCYSCDYCYVSDLALSSKKTNTTRRLPVI